MGFEPLETPQIKDVHDPSVLYGAYDARRPLRFGVKWGLYAKGGKAKFAYNVCALETYHVGAERPIQAGVHQVRMEFAYDGGGLAKGGTVSLYYDGEKVGAGRVERSVPFVFSADETTDVGRDTGTPVTADYDLKGSAFTGTVNWVQIDTGKEDHDHLIRPEDRLHLAMARQ